MDKMSTLIFISDKTLNPDSQLFNLDQFFDMMDSNLEMVFGNFELTPTTNIHQLINKTIHPEE